MSGAQAAVTKRCTKCGEVKSLEEFTRQKKASGGRRARCRACMREDGRQYREQNRESERARVRRWREENPQPRRPKRPPLTPEERRERRRAYDARYRAEHPEVGWRSAYRHRAKHYGHEPVVEAFTRDDVIARWGDGCWHCPDGEFEELDHFPVSVADGGSHTLDNVRPACRRSNLQGVKGAELRRELIAERDQIIRAAEAEMKSRQSWADHGYVRAA